MSSPLVTAIVSTYNSERFIRGCLEDLLRQSLAEALEIVVIDSGSQEGEADAVQAFQRDHPGRTIRYVRTEREPLYAAWNRAVGLARGRYITNANTDDRHRPDALERMAWELERRGVGIVYGDNLITQGENETWEANTAYVVAERPDYSLRQALVYYVFGPQPMWRRDVHEAVGLFDPSYEVAGDLDMHLRTARRFGAWHVREVLGLYYEGEGIERSKGRQSLEEAWRVLARRRREVGLEEVYPGLARSPEDPVAWGAAWVDFALAVLEPPFPDPALARASLQEAARVLGAEPAVRHDLAWLECVWGDRQQGLADLRALAALGYGPAREALREAQAGRAPRPVRLPHPVVQELPPLKPVGAIRRPWPGPRQAAGLQ